MFFLLIWCLFRLGLDKNILAKLINSSTGQCWSSQIYNPCPGIVPNIPSNNDYNGGFACELMTKDLLFALGMLISLIIKLISLSL
jgi:3-hydroxyisobutyrate dehydrogenase